ncbi:hypothetical protein [Streptomyces rimosus]|uniref:hypothetical protein n=1 Tax=Streptomyces rimosus TaxID=1927 RepID=UPI0037BA717D
MEELLLRLLGKVAEERRADAQEAYERLLSFLPLPGEETAINGGQGPTGVSDPTALYSKLYAPGLAKRLPLTTGRTPPFRSPHRCRPSCGKTSGPPTTRLTISSWRTGSRRSTCLETSSNRRPEFDTLADAYARIAGPSSEQARSVAPKLHGAAPNPAWSPMRGRS